MKLYYDKNINLETQKQEILGKLDINLNIQNQNQKILIQCLFNLNILIQNIHELDILNNLSTILKSLKENLDITKNNIFTLETLKQSLNIIDFSDEKSFETIENYNKLASSFDKLLSENMCNTNNFILEYMNYFESISYNLFCYNFNKQETEDNDDNLEKEIEIEEKIESETDDIIEDKQEIALETKNLKDNKVLLISETKNKVFLPYLISDLNRILKNNKSYNSIEEIINSEYIISLDKYKNSIIARFKETFNLMRKKEKASISDSLNLALELSFNNYLNPAIITACKNLDELDIYLDCLNSNELDKFSLFEIKYEILPK